MSATSTSAQTDNQTFLDLMRKPRGERTPFESNFIKMMGVRPLTKDIFVNQSWAWGQIKHFATAFRELEPGEAKTLFESFLRNLDIVTENDVGRALLGLIHPKAAVNDFYGNIHMEIVPLFVMELIDTLQSDLDKIPAGAIDLFYYEPLLEHINEVLLAYHSNFATQRGTLELIAPNDLQLDQLKKNESVAESKLTEFRDFRAKFEEKVASRKRPYSEEYKLVSPGEQAPLAPPKIIHYIWLGSAMPDNYQANIQRVADHFGPLGYEIKIWVDDMDNYSAHAHDDVITVISIDDLRQELLQSPFFSDTRHEDLEETRDEEFWAAYASEANPDAPNYGAASDILRYGILFIFGGIYLDTDTSLILDDTTSAQDFNFSGVFQQGGFIPQCDGRSINNALLASHQHGVSIAESLDSVLSLYQQFSQPVSVHRYILTELREQAASRNGVNKAFDEWLLECITSEMSLSEMKSTTEYREARLLLTLLESGPIVLKKLLKETGLIDMDSLGEFSTGEADPTVLQFCGVLFEHAGDTSWIPKENVITEAALYLPPIDSPDSGAIELNFTLNNGPST